ncbi:hypothetical protein P153DRAFT_361604 [Dothidotthia symphoricarpi CBS 119687]|uniref:Uncharacterized protein n=1 Tax=Dothidotthia symphoricarpi CBS 119687 TaxID=1392245 RepID=A0A6A5ZYJ8_9PLEO|nr:uncharacterized protein P153DRAFT_361604 [Dothidotthia symphoricarpi CBS 119687]KAF2123974.1 hypothetical protein P153DRAFT_361604 [Dothidotthia symphoricarpi CBS 119687]
MSQRHGTPRGLRGSRSAGRHAASQGTKTSPRTCHDTPLTLSFDLSSVDEYAANTYSLDSVVEIARAVYDLNTIYRDSIGSHSDVNMRMCRKLHDIACRADSLALIAGALSAAGSAYGMKLVMPVKLISSHDDESVLMQRACPKGEIIQDRYALYIEYQDGSSTLIPAVLFFAGQHRQSTIRRSHTSLQDPRI